MHVNFMHMHLVGNLAMSCCKRFFVITEVVALWTAGPLMEFNGVSELSVVCIFTTVVYLLLTFMH